MKRALFLLAVLIWIAGCTKTEVVKVPNNVPPPDHTIDSSTIAIYVNKCYINMLGRKPIGIEQSNAVTQLRQHNFSADDRKAFLQTIFTQPEYNRNLYIIADNQYLKSTDSATIAGQIFLFNYLAGLPDYAPYLPIITYENTRLDTLQHCITLMNQNKMDYRQMLMRICNNYFYDQINMGTQNFVVSTYQNFLFRYPTGGELTAAEVMVDGNPSEVFLKAGKTKDDYLNIFFTSNDYYEGQVRFIFKLYLFREPNSAEIAYYGDIYKSTGDYKQLQLAVFSTNEYAGLQ